MDVSAFLSDASFWMPGPSAKSSAQSVFYPVACWLVDAAKPSSVLAFGGWEPGLRPALREAVNRIGLRTTCVVVEPFEGADSDRPLFDASFAKDWELRPREFQAFSRFERGPIEGIIESFPDRSIDLIQPGESYCADRFRRDLEKWRPKLSPRSILLVPRAGVREEKGGARRFLLEISRHHRSFFFDHGEGLGLVALGDAPPEVVRALFDADETPELRDAIRMAYSRLGRGLIETAESGLEGRARTLARGPAILGLEASGRPTTSAADLDAADLGALVLRGENDLLREENERLIAELDLLDESGRVLSAENAALRRENPELRELAAWHEHLHAMSSRQLDELRQSAALALIEKGQRIRRRLFPQSRLHGRCAELAVRFARDSIKIGPHVAVKKAVNRVLRKAKLIGRPAPSSPLAAKSWAPALGSSSAGAGFEDLPWVFTGRRGPAGPRGTPALKILLISHSACRTGAPHCLLRLSEGLAKIPGVECWVVLRSGGELAPQFARQAPTLEMATAEASGFDRAGFPAMLASRFREYSRNVIAVCNTMTVSEFHEAFEAAEIPVISWIHELPTFIDILGGREAIDRIQSASFRTIVPANVVRDALVQRFDFDPSRVQTVYNGLDAKGRGLSRERMRAKVREELDLPADARIVLGCGTIDLRKGVDLFAQLGRTFLLETAPKDLASRTYFVWVGHTSDPDLLKWLRHDLETAGLSDRVLFPGSRPDMAPYFLASDLFALTSREDPCPFANLEAMESALAVVAFQGSGGAPEVLGDGGIVAPYLDVPAMAEAARDLLADDERRNAMGLRGQASIRNHFTWPRFMTEFREILEAECGLGSTKQPKVSVILPNFNHAAFLETRLRSIFEQTVAPLEIIYLDNASTDESVEVVRRLAPESPVPLRIIVNEKNNNSTFLQWLKGFELAQGDLVWIAESDDCAHPQFLERLLPEFADPEVDLAYSQSALIDSDERLLAEHFLDHTDGVSTTRWRSRYVATGADEAELALSQKNTIPNASAVVFRRPDLAKVAGELSELRFAGDWIFYAMRIQDGKIAFLPESLNFYRRHVKTVSHRSFLTDTHAEETLYVKVRVFEMFDVSFNAMSRGLCQTFLDHAMIARRFHVDRPTLTKERRPAITALLDRARSALNRRLDDHEGLKTLFILDSDGGDLDEQASLNLINALARDHRVYLCVASPSAEAEALSKRLDDRVVLIEGTLGVTPWSVMTPEGCLRAEVLAEMARFHGVDVIHSQSGAADRLASQINAELKLPWLIQLDDRDGYWLDDSADPGHGEALATVSGVFHEASDLGDLIESRPELASKRWIRAFDGLDPDALVGASTTIDKREDELWVYLVTSGGRSAEDLQSAMAAIRIINRLSSVERGNLRVKLVAPSAVDSPSAVGIGSAITARDGVGELALISRCDLAIAPHAGQSRRVSSRIAALLAHQVPIIAPDRGAIRDMLASDIGEVGWTVESEGRPTVSADRLAAAILGALRRTDRRAEHREAARRLFEDRFHVDRTSAVVAEAYLHARDLLVFSRAARSEPTLETRSTKGIASRESA